MKIVIFILIIYYKELITIDIKIMRNHNLLNIIVKQEASMSSFRPINRINKEKIKNVLTQFLLIILK